ncbi:MAG TPA: helix-turn-helix transcriptional regulator [Thermoanaerobaculia bacterium]|nr:helix-turn-helix transcriptional regulator [Thermoanaerobaculia bacterium]
MPIVITVDRLLQDRKMKAKDLAAAIGVSETHMSLFRSGKVRGVRFTTLAKLCAALDCQPGDLLGYVDGDEDDDETP